MVLMEQVWQHAQTVIFQNYQVLHLLQLQQEVDVDLLDKEIQVDQAVEIEQVMEQVVQEIPQQLLLLKEMMDLVVHLHLDLEEVVEQVLQEMLVLVDLLEELEELEEMAQQIL
jgi:hypothetical protein